MSEEHAGQDRCFHCGGILTFSAEDTFSCLMCGRDAGHKCENCINLPEEKVEEKPAPKTKAKTSRKKAGVSK